MPRIAIAGAGVAGLAVALALRRQGFDVVVCEQAGRLAEVGAGLQLSPNGTRVLRWLGIEAALEPLACEARAKEVRLWNTGQRWTLFDLGEDCRSRFGAPYWMVHRADLQAALLDALNAVAPGALRLASRVVTATSHAGGVDITLENGEVLQADALVAADGVHSALRTAIGAGAAPARYTGLLAWRGLVPTQNLPPALRAPVGTNWVGPGGHVITYPLRAGALMNVVGITEHAGWTSESWMERGSHEDLLRAFGQWHPDVRTLMQAIEEPYRWALLARPPRRGWWSGRTVLLGDAAHPTLPFLAQGANMALEDACVLARCLAALPVPQAFARFEALRWERTSTIVDRSADNAARFHDARLADPVTAVGYVDSEWQPEQVRRRYDWLFSYDATTVPI